MTPNSMHWSQIGDFQQGDIKLIWEPSRFAFAYLLVRAYWRTGDERYPEIFWQTLDNWRSENQPNQGANWKCGQETAFRVMAWIFALYGFQESAGSTPQRVAQLLQMLALSGERIEANLDYALSQQNNHSISEPLGLWTIGLLFPELRNAAHWERVGRRCLEEQAQKLLYDDGGFAQHSVNYHRVMLHDYLWVIRLAELNQVPFSPELRQRIGKAGEWLYLLQDEHSGQFPNYGANDGALVLPLDNCDFTDYRPVMQAIHMLTGATRLFASGPWDECLFWIFGPTVLDAPIVEMDRRPLNASDSGYYTLRSATTMLFTRCPTHFRHRPSHADLLHLDLWWKGVNIALDPGTYSYNADPPWDKGLECTRYHNTITVDESDQMERAGRFLWLPWAQGRVRTHQIQENALYWEGEHDGYQRLPSAVRYRRAVLEIDSEVWLVLDQLQSQGQHTYRLHWSLADLPFVWQPERGILQLLTSAGSYYLHSGANSGPLDFSLKRGDEHSPRGWQSRYYAERLPALSMAGECQQSSSLLWTLFSPTRGQIQFEGGLCLVSIGVTTTTVQINDDWNTPLVTSVTKNGKISTTMDFASCAFC
jgi:asparagine synthase (glutamine-hydrolysing)